MTVFVLVERVTCRAHGVRPTPKPWRLEQENIGNIACGSCVTDGFMPPHALTIAFVPAPPAKEEHGEDHRDADMPQG